MDEFAERQFAVGHEQVFDDGVVEHGQAQPVGVQHVLGEVLVPDRVVGLGHGGRPEQYVVVHVDADVRVQQRVLGLQERHVLQTGLQVGGPQPGRLAQLDAYGARERLFQRHRRRRRRLLRTVADHVVFFLGADHGGGGGVACETNSICKRYNEKQRRR